MMNDRSFTPFFPDVVDSFFALISFCFFFVYINIYSTQAIVFFLIDIFLIYILIIFKFMFQLISFICVFLLLFI
jgi:hypothetical protein